MTIENLTTPRSTITKLGRIVAKRLRILKLSRPGQLMQIAADPRSTVQRRAEAIYLMGLSSLTGKLDATHQSVVRTLLKALQEDTPLVARCAAVALAQMGDSRAVSRLIKITSSTEPEGNRRAAVHALGFLGNRRSERALREVLTDKRAPAGLKGEAAEAISSLGVVSKRTRLALAEGLTDESPEVRYFCAFALGFVGQKGDKQLLRALLKDRATVPGFGSVAKEAASAIGRLGGRRTRKT